MSYFSSIYLLVFLPIVIIIYNILPKKIRSIILTLSSLVFFYLYSKWLIIFVILSSISIYISGYLMHKLDEKKNSEVVGLDLENKKKVKLKYQRRKKLILIGGIIFNVFFLFYFKYLGFFKHILNSLFNFSKSNKIINHIAPIGISFYTFSSLSYLIDVYREKCEYEKNPFQLLLYLTFFPTLVEGPITRYNDIRDYLKNNERVTYKNFCFGYQRIIYGLFKKMVIADRLNIFVKIIFNDYNKFNGPIVFLGAIFYTILLYMEFSGTMDIVIGSGEIFDIKIKENFRQPFFSKNISEFWSRWHISLGLWFKDYIFYPVSLSKIVKKITSKIKKMWGNHSASIVMGAISLFVVWSLNGLWHGAGYQFLFFGYYHFFLILLGNIFEPIILKIYNKLKINRDNIIVKILRIIKTCLLVFMGELFFRANNLTSGLAMAKIIFTKINFHGFTHNVLSLGLDIKDYIVIFISLLFVLIVSVMNEKGLSLREELSKKNIVIRWLCFYAIIISIIVFGAYGDGYAPVPPIYADF